MKLTANVFDLDREGGAFMLRRSVPAEFGRVSPKVLDRSAHRFIVFTVRPGVSAFITAKDVAELEHLICEMARLLEELDGGPHELEVLHFLQPDAAAAVRLAIHGGSGREAA